MWSNFGPVVQVKHVSLTGPVARGISNSIRADEIVIVCKTAEAELITSLISQLGLRIRGIITQSELEEWYSLCFGKYADTMGTRILGYLSNGFEDEFVYLGTIHEFLETRNYNINDLKGVWAIDNMISL